MTLFSTKNILCV